MRIGFVGLGNMGRVMADRLVAAGHRVTGFDLDERARADFAGRGGLAAEDLVGACRDADLVILMLPGSDAVEAVVARMRDALTGDLVDMSSSEPLRTRALAASLAGQGTALVDAPVSGGVAGARAGTLTIMVGGEDSVIERVSPVLSVFGSIVRAGPIGAGHAAKALNNLLSATHLWATSEAMAAGRAFGLEPETLLAIFNGSSGRSGSTETKWPKFILSGTFDSGFALRLMVKDMAIAVDLARQVGASIDLGAASFGLWEEASTGLDAAADHTEVAAWVASHDDPGREPAPPVPTRPGGGARRRRRMLR